MEIRQAYQAMIKAMQGGWGAMAGALGFSITALENRVYEKKGQAMLVETAMLMQSFSGTTLFAEAVARASGGVFVQIPQADDVDNEALLLKFNQLHANLGLLSKRFAECTADGELSNREKSDLKSIGDEIHMTMQELLQLTFRVYCPRSEEGAAG